MGNVISVVHYGAGSNAAETLNCDDEKIESSARGGAADEKQNSGAESENKSVDSENGDEHRLADEPEDKIDDAANIEMTRKEEMEQFYKELAVKREARRKIIAEKTNEMKSLQKQLATERRIREKVIKENDVLKSLLASNNINIDEFNLSEEMTNGSIVGELQSNMAEMEQANNTLKKQNICLRSELSESHCSLQSVNSDNALLNKEIYESKRQIVALKEVVDVSKKMLAIRESQLMQLKEKLLEIEKSIADRETALLSDDLRAEYEKQLQNIRNLRLLYEERARVAEVTRRNLTRQLEDQKLITSAEIDKNQGMSKQIEELQKEIQEKEDVISSKDDQLGICKTETKGLQVEMAGINKLFTQMILGHNQSQDLDKLVNRLEEHHDLLRDMAVKEHCSDAASALPKLLLDLVSQVENDSTEEEVSDKEVLGPGASKGLTSSQEIVGNLPKVWRVLVELLSHQHSSIIDSQEDGERSSSCYTSVQTPSGTHLVPSVSKTYIRLKDLILEKKSLQKEMTKMKQLNSHLENRLQGQERRLCLVSSELTKTWHVVGRLRRHHQQLHTHEKILRYELQQKRKMLNEIKEELEYCREKWDMARQKNTNTELEWKKLRKEFADRKLRKADDSVSTSAESGFSDEKQSDDEDSRSFNNCSREEKVHAVKKKLLTVDILPDSTTDQNPMAEGEDPISDMVDVTDLPLDDQDNESEDISNTNGDMLSESEDQADIEDSSIADMGTKPKFKAKHKLISKVSRNIENLIEIDRSCAILEDEDNTRLNKNNIEEAPQPKCSIERPESTVENKNICLPVPDKSNKYENTSASQASPQSVPNLISPGQILENIRLQNERLSLRDERMKKLEAGCNHLTRQVIRANNRGNLLTKKVDVLSNKSKMAIDTCDQNSNGGSNECEEAVEDSTVKSINRHRDDFSLQTEVENSKMLKINNIDSGSFESTEIKDSDHDNNLTQRLAYERVLVIGEEDKQNKDKIVCSCDIPSSSKTDDLMRTSEILENDGKENECACVVNENILRNDDGEILIQQLSQTEKNNIETKSNNDRLMKNEESNDREEVANKVPPVDYEARLVAKEERLKRLEDQAKSLVKKVNNTKTKRVKIDYKLQELHNIYGMSDDQSTSNDSLGPEESTVKKDNDNENSDADGEIKSADNK